MTNTEMVRAYYAAWLRDDMEAVLKLCTDDVVAVNVPIGPLHGKPAVREFFNKFGSGMTNKRYDIHDIIESGDSAVVEGVENYMKGGKAVSLPYMSMFKFRAGMISEWRDYFDMQTVLRQLGLPLDGSRPAKTRAAPAA
jgi:limonene-1,2-epoxide hydrolase